MVLSELNSVETTRALSAALKSVHAATRLRAARGLQALQKQLAADPKAAKEVLKALGEAGATETQGPVLRVIYEAIDRHAQDTCNLPLPAFHSTWAGSGGLDFFLGNPAQQSVFQLMLSAYNKALLTGDPALIDLALWLAGRGRLKEGGALWTAAPLPVPGAPNTFQAGTGPSSTLAAVVLPLT